MANLDKIYTKKQQEVLRQYLSQDFYFMINSGSVRSGKTEIDNDILLMELREIRKRADKLGIQTPQYILAGSSIGTFYRNVIMQLNNKYGLDISLDKYNSFTLYGVRCYVFGHNNIGDLKKITGVESFGAYINELTKANKEVVDEILKRCSGEGARIIADTNPDSPTHWVMTDYILKADNKSIIYNNFLLDENTFLNERYIREVKATTPSGVFYRRKILGEWCSSDGAIYEDYDNEKHIISEVEFKKKNIISYFAGVDWGYAEGHEGVIIVVAEDTEHNFYVCENICENKKDISWWVEKARQLNKKYKDDLIKREMSKTGESWDKVAYRTNDIYFYCDTARPEHIDAFIYNNLWAYNADKSVMAGIELVAKMLKVNNLYIVENRAKALENDLYNYVWDSNGLPKKVNDNNADALRYALYTHLKDRGE